MKKSDVTSAVRTLRLALGDSQQEFGQRLKIAIRTVARYEGDMPPRGRALSKLARLAFELGFKEQAAIFRAALEAEMGLSVPLPESTKGPAEWRLGSLPPEANIYVNALIDLMTEVVRQGGDLGVLSSVHRMIDSGFQRPPIMKAWKSVQNGLKPHIAIATVGNELWDVGEARKSAIRDLQGRGYSLERISKALNLDLEGIQQLIDEG